MSRLLLPALAFWLIAVPPAYAADEDVSVAEFLELWDGLDGPAMRQELEDTGTLDRSHYPALVQVTDIMNAVAHTYRERIEAERAAGQVPHSCLPEGEAKLNTDDFIPHLLSYAEEERAHMSLAAAFDDHMLKTFPCH